VKSNVTCYFIQWISQYPTGFGGGSCKEKWQQQRFWGSGFSRNKRWLNDFFWLSLARIYRKDLWLDWIACRCGFNSRSTKSSFDCCKIRLRYVCGPALWFFFGKRILGVWRCEVREKDPGSVKSCLWIRECWMNIHFNCPGRTCNFWWGKLPTGRTLENELAEVCQCGIGKSKKLFY